MIGPAPVTLLEPDLVVSSAVSMLELFFHHSVGSMRLAMSRPVDFARSQNTKDDAHRIFCAVLGKPDSLVVSGGADNVWQGVKGP